MQSNNAKKKTFNKKELYMNKNTDKRIQIFLYIKKLYK